MLDIPEKIKIKIISILSNERKVKQAILFGSRARGDSKINSDIDLALVGYDIPVSLNTKLRDAAGLYTLDIVRMDGLDNDSLIANIERDGVLIYGREETSALA
jgi:predicted nucleotidyltransferase